MPGFRLKDEMNSLDTGVAHQEDRSHSDSGRIAARASSEDGVFMVLGLTPVPFQFPPGVTVSELKTESINSVHPGNSR